METMPAKPMDARAVLDAYFLETRCKLIEIAANLDRVNRAPGFTAHRGDPRLMFIVDALEILLSAAPNRAELIQRLYSKE